MSDGTSSDSNYTVPISGGQGVLVGDGTQHNNHGPVIQIANMTGQDVAQVVAELAKPIVSAPENLWNVPFPRNLFFTGREEILQQLELALSATKQATLTQALTPQGQTISGLGGVGKTQTALEYAHRHRAEYLFVFWAQADAAVTLDTEFRRIALLLNLPQKDAQEAEQVREAVKHWLTTESGYLLILDNADDPPALKAFLPPQPAGHILITSRAHSLGTLRGTFRVASPISLPMLTPEQSVAFLLARTERPETSGAELTAATELAQELGGLPLALEQVGAYIAQGISFADYLTSYRRRAHELLTQHRPEIGDSEKTVAVTWSLNFEAVEQESAASAELLRLSAFLAPERIPEEIFTTDTPELGESLTDALKDAASDPLRMTELLAPLVRYSLIERDIESKTYDIHRLVQAVIQARMDEGIRRIYAERLVRAIDGMFLSPEYRTWPLYERFLTHAMLCTRYAESYRFVFAEAARLINNVGCYLYQRAQYAEAEPLYEQALEIREATVGSQDPDTAISLNNLGALYRNQGKYEVAESLLMRALEIREATSGIQHPDTASLLSNLAALHGSQGKYAEAEPLLVRAIAIQEATLEPQHPAIASSLNNLAGCYNSQGRYEEAEPLLKRALTLRETTLGPQHPDIATSLNSLASLYDRQGKYAEAELLLVRAREIQEATLGPQHLSTATSLNNLANLYINQRRDAEAELLIKQALIVYEQALGPQHPDTATSLNNLAVLYGYQGKYAQAEPLSMRALKIREATLAPEHPDIATSLNTLADIYSNQGKYLEAEPLQVRALTVWEKALGTEHPDIATSLNNLANLYSNQGRYDQAELLYKRALATIEKTLGAEHPKIAASLSNLAYSYKCQGKYTEAAPLYRQALTIAEKVLGKEHPTTVIIQENYTILQQKLNPLRKSEKRKRLWRKKNGGSDIRSVWFPLCRIL